MQRTRNWRRRIEPRERRALAHDHVSRLQRMERPAVRVEEGDRLVHLLRRAYWDNYPFLQATLCGCFVHLGDKSLTKHNAWKATPTNKPATCLVCLHTEKPCLNA